MHDSLPLFERLLQWASLPACLYGAGGAIMHSVRKGRSAAQVLFEAMGGVITTNMLSPLIQEWTPERWHYTLYFLAGWGGLEFVSRCYEAAVSALEHRIRRHINPGSGPGHGSGHEIDREDAQ